MLRAEELDKLGFDLGWDFAVYGIRPTENALPSILEGYEYGTQQKCRKHADIFIRKYLYLRYSALNRGRAVSEYVTPQLISYLCVRRCPITREALTARTGHDTDWSIDRVNNNGAYAPGNMVVMSVRANKAKGCKSSDDILEIVKSLEKSKDKEYEGLTVMEWRRLSWLSEKCDKERLVPMVVKPPPLVMLSSFDAMQLVCAMSANQNRASRVKKICNKTQAKTFMKFVKAHSKYCYHEMPIRIVLDAFQAPAVFDKFCDFYHTLLESSVDNLTEMLSGVMYEPVGPGSYKAADFTSLKHILRKLWMLDTNGYVSDMWNPLSQSESDRLEAFLNREIGKTHITQDSFDPFLS